MWNADVTLAQDYPWDACRSPAPSGDLPPEPIVEGEQVDVQQRLEPKESLSDPHDGNEGSDKSSRWSEGTTKVDALDDMVLELQKPKAFHRDTFVSTHSM